MTSLAATIAQYDQEADEEQAILWQGAAPRFSPQLLALVEELRSDQLLTEAALAWVRTKKREIAGATLGVLYTQEQLKDMLEKSGTKEEPTE